MANETKKIDLAPVIFTILSVLLSAISGPLRELLTQLMKTLYVNSKKTPSPVDDIFVRTLAAILGVDCE